MGKQQHHRGARPRVAGAFPATTTGNQAAIADPSPSTIEIGPPCPRHRRALDHEGRASSRLSNQTIENVGDHLIILRREILFAEQYLMVGGRTRHRPPPHLEGVRRCARWTAGSCENYSPGRAIHIERDRHAPRRRLARESPSRGAARPSRGIRVLRARGDPSASRLESRRSAMFAERRLISLSPCGEREGGAKRREGVRGMGARGLRASIPPHPSHRYAMGPFPLSHKGRGRSTIPSG